MSSLPSPFGVEERHRLRGEVRLRQARALDAEASLSVSVERGQAARMRGTDDVEVAVPVQIADGHRAVVDREARLQLAFLGVGHGPFREAALPVTDPDAQLPAAHAVRRGDDVGHPVSVHVGHDEARAPHPADGKVRLLRRPQANARARARRGQVFEIGGGHAGSGRGGFRLGRTGTWRLLRALLALQLRLVGEHLGFRDVVVLVVFLEEGHSLVRQDRLADVVVVHLDVVLLGQSPDHVGVRLLDHGRIDPRPDSRRRRRSRNRGDRSGRRGLVRRRRACRRGHQKHQGNLLH